MQSVFRADLKSRAAAARPIRIHEPRGGADEGEPFDLEAFLYELDEAMATGRNEDQVIEIWDGYDVEAALTDDEDALQRAFNLRHARLAGFSTINAG